MRLSERSGRIAILCHSGAGGSGVMATELAVLLSELGHHVHVVGERRPFRLEPVLRAQESEYQDLGEEPPAKSFWGQLARLARMGFQRSPPIPQEARSNPRAGSLHFHEILSHEYPLFEGSPHLTLKAANTVAALIEKFNIEIVNAHYAIPHATAAILARDAGLPIRVVTTLHGTDVTSVGIDPAYRFTTQHALRCSDAVTAVSSSLIESVRRDLGVDRDIHRVSNWVDTTRFIRNDDPKARARYAQPEERLLVHVSNFRPVKNSQNVIEVFARVCEQMPSRLFLVGEGPEKAACIAKAVELGVSGRVLSLPPMVDIERILGISDVLLLPSLSEAMPLVILEAMAAGVLCVCSQVGGVPEIVSHGETGFLLPPMDVEGMAEAALQALREPGIATEIRAKALAMVTKQHSPALIVQQYLAVFEEVLAR